MNTIRWLRLLRDEWQKLYRYHGGWWTELRCLFGAFQIKRGWFRQSSMMGEVETLTFSVIPKMTSLWAHFMLRVVERIPQRILICDSAGTLSHYLPAHPALQIFPVFNYSHGTKLDMFIHHVCRAEYVVVSDDDIFWLSGEAIRWALAQFERNPRLAVVSLLPFPLTPEMSERKILPSMGSCFVIRREIWVREKVSFEVDRTPLAQGLNWIYDTGGKAQLQLLERGYEIVYLPMEMRNNFIALQGMSTWMLKTQKHRGDLRESIEKHVGLEEKIQQKALQMVVAARRLAVLFAQVFPGHMRNDLTESLLLDRIEVQSRKRLSPEEFIEVEAEVDHLMNRLGSALDGEGQETHAADR